MNEEPESNAIYPTRRTFLKVSGIAALGSAMAAESAVAANEVVAGNRASTPVPLGKLADRVNVLQGTASTEEFSRGNTLPIAALPFGMNHWTIQSQADTPWMFQPGVRRTQGFRCTHQISPWLDDYGHATFLPFRGDIHSAAQPRASSYRPEDAVLRPYSLEMFLLRYRAKVELIPTERGCIISAEFEKTENAQIPGVVIDVPGTGVFEQDIKNRRIRFTSTANAGGVPSNFASYYVVEFPEEWHSFEVKEADKHRIATVRFPAGHNIEARIATSFISFEQAAINLEREVGTKSPAALREAAASQWNEYLQRVVIEGASVEQQTTFYSCLYRVLLFPRVWYELDATGAMHHFSAFNGRVAPGIMYADHGYWDVYRAWYPLMSILFPERLGDILQSWVNAYKEGGWFPQFPSPGYRACMTGSLIDAVMADAVVKKIQGFDVPTAYAGLKQHATRPGDPAKGYGRVGIESYLKNGYVAADRIRQSVAETVDAAYGDYCIAQIAKALGEHEDYAFFMKRSRNWRRVFDPELKFFRGKNEDGSWEGHFDEFTWGSPYVEGGAWQHRWDAPHDIDNLLEAMGGKAAGAQNLEKMLTMQPVFNVGVYGEEIHEMSEMAAVPFGQYAHSNQPVHHVLYLFANAGRPDRTQYWTRKVMNELYTPDTFAGDEDSGSMAAWYILSALGFFSACPGKPEYTLGSPLFTKATLHLAGDKTFLIEAAGNGPESMYVKSIALNGKPQTGPVLQHEVLMRGGKLLFEMTKISPA